MKKKGILALALAGVMCLGLLAGCNNNSGNGGNGGNGGGGSTGETIKIGYVNPETGALAGNGEGAKWVIEQIETYVNETMGGIEVDGATKNIQVVYYDSQSDSGTCTEMAQKLVQQDQVDMLIAIQTPETVIPVVNTAEAFGVPCIAIQAPVDAVAGALTADAQWTVHAFWTIEKVYEQYRALWTAAGYPPSKDTKVGLAFANDADGTAWHTVFAQRVAEDYTLVDPDQYPPDTTDFTNIVNTFKSEGIDILAGTNTPPNFSDLFTQVISAGVEVGCITMGKCCLLPGDIAALGDNVEGIMTEVWWDSTYPWVSDLTGVNCADLGAAYSEGNDGRSMPQPAGYAYAALELAVHAFKTAGTTDKAAVVEAMKSLDVETIVGPIKYDQEMNGLTYSDTVISGGQWQSDGEGGYKLVIIDNTVYDQISTTGSYVEGNATQK